MRTTEIPFAHKKEENPVIYGNTKELEGLLSEICQAWKTDAV